MADRYLLLGPTPAEAGTTGGELVQAETAADARAVHGGRVIDPLTGSGWSATATSGGASAVWSTGPARLVLAVPTSSQGEAGVERAGYLPESDEWDILLRVDVIAGDASDRTRVTLSGGQSATDCAVLQMWTDGTLEIGRQVGGAYAGIAYGAASGLDSGARTGGQLWLRLSHRVGRVSAMWGVGSAGAVPAVWRAVYQDEAEATATAACGTYVRITAATTDSSVGSGLTVDALAIRATGQSGGAL